MPNLNAVIHTPALRLNSSGPQCTRLPLNTGWTQCFGHRDLTMQGHNTLHACLLGTRSAGSSVQCWKPSIPFNCALNYLETVCTAEEISSYSLGMFISILSFTENCLINLSRSRPSCHHIVTVCVNNEALVLKHSLHLPC